MSTTDTLDDPAMQNPHDLQVFAQHEPAACPGANSGGRPDKPMQRPGHAQLIASWSAQARPTLTMQRQLVARLVG